MTELRAAAERLRRHHAGDKTVYERGSCYDPKGDSLNQVGLNQMANDESILADAYLAAQGEPESQVDGRPTAAWLKERILRAASFLHNANEWWDEYYNDGDGTVGDKLIADIQAAAPPAAEREGT